MSEANPDADTVVDTICNPSLWADLCDGVNTVSQNEEAVFEFREDGVRIGVADAANVVVIEQFAESDAFEHYEVEQPTSFGLDTQKFENILGVVDTSVDTVEASVDMSTRSMNFRSTGLESSLAGIDPESVTGRVEEIPFKPDKYDYNMEIDLPVAGWERGTDVIELSGSDTGVWRFDPDDESVVLEGRGDTDMTRVILSEEDGFGFRDDPPENAVEMVQSNQYMSDLVTVWDGGTVEMIWGAELPYYMAGTRHGEDIETAILQAPRVDA